MRVLLLHPEDSPWDGPWGGSRWDLIVDLGFASSYTYEEWSHRSGARVLSIHQFAGQTESHRWINEVLDHGRGQLLDRMGLDWWEILAVSNYQDLRALYLLDQLRPEIAASTAEFAASRPHIITKILQLTLGHRVRYFQNETRRPVSQVQHMLRSARKLRLAQIVEIAFDKWDPDYRFRRHVAKHKQANLAEPVVLLPSAYSNVTRSVLAYAAQLPDRRFLLVTTRRNGMPDRLPGNVTAAPIAAYAMPSNATQEETLELRNAWEVFLRTTLQGVDKFRHAANAGLWDYFPTHLESGLRLREAWRRLLQCEPVKGVLCADDLNYYTGLPLILAGRQGLNSVYCSHGALDGGLLFKMPVADSYLVKGEMEGDYLQRARAIKPENIWVAAPGSNAPVASNGDEGSGDLVFFSQPYEVGGGRADEIYREVLPRLYFAAQRSARKMIVKLHPFESKQARKVLIAAILPKGAHDEVDIVSGAAPEEILSHTWCGVTVDSSVAVECTLRKIPFFLCGWLDFTGLGYLQQFARFGVGRVLDAPESLEQIPEMVAAHRADPVVIARLWHAADPAQLDEIMFGNRQMRSPHPCAC